MNVKCNLYTLREVSTLRTFRKYRKTLNKDLKFKCWYILDNINRDVTIPRAGRVDLNKTSVGVRKIFMLFKILALIGSAQILVQFLAYCVK